MKQLLLLLMLTAFLSQNAFTQKRILNETEEKKAERLQWWEEAKFGMFITGAYMLYRRVFISAKKLNFMENGL